MYSSVNQTLEDDNFSKIDTARGSTQKHAAVLRIASFYGCGLLLVVILFLTNTGFVHAERITKLNTSLIVPACPAEDAPVTKVLRAYKETAVNPDGTQQVSEVELGDTITMEVQDFATLRDEAACTGKHIVLYLDERPLKDITAFPPTDSTKPILRFPLNRTESSRDVWTFLLSGPKDLNTRVTKVSIGIEDEFAVPSDGSINLIVIPRIRFGVWALLFVAIVVTFFWLAWQSDILRDSAPQPNSGERKPFSLARSQAAWWFFIILASYLFIGLITHDFSTTITGTVLALLGISAATAVGARIIDTSTVSPMDIQRQKSSASNTESKLSTLGTEIQTLQAIITLGQQQNDTATQTLTVKQKGLGENVTEKTSIESKLLTLVTEIQTLQANIEAEERQNAQTTQTLADKKRELDKKETEKTSLKSKLSTLQGDINTLNTDIPPLQGLKQPSPQTTQALADKQMRLSKKEIEKTSLESKLSTLQGDINTLNADKLKLQGVQQLNPRAPQAGLQWFVALIRPGTQAPTTPSLADKQTRLSKKETEKTSLESKLSTLQGDIGKLQPVIEAEQKKIASDTEALAKKQEELDAKVTEKASLEIMLKKLSSKSNNFLTDVLNDTTGVSFHRFQIFAWTIVLGIIFVIQVYSDLAMPTFDSTLLGLLGISAGTYLGLKIPEGKNP